MERITWTSFIAYSIIFAVVIQLLVLNPVMAQSQNTTLPQDTNNTRAIWNMKDRTITLVDPTTNETKIIGSIAVNTGNATTNETLTTNTGNATTNANLTAKFNALQGK